MLRVPSDYHQGARLKPSLRNALIADVRLLQNEGRIVNRVSLATPAITGTIEQKQGIAAFSSGNRLNFTSFSLGASQPFSVAWCQILDSFSADQVIFEIQFSAAYKTIAAHHTSTGIAVGRSEAGMPKSSGAVGQVPGQLDVYCAVFRGGNASTTSTNTFLFKNGRRQTMDTSGSYLERASAVFCVGDLNGGGTPVNGSIGRLLVWSRGLTEDEACLASSRNIYDVFELDDDYVDAASAASVPTLFASTYVEGSLTSTGWRPQITAI